MLFFSPWAPGQPVTCGDGAYTLDFQERLRVESRDNTFDFNDAPNGLGSLTDSTLLHQRFRVGLTGRLSPGFGFTLQGQDSREFSDRHGVPFLAGSEGDNPFDLRLAYADFLDPKQSPVTVRLGRQTLTFGDERLVGAAEWTNFGRVFDAARATWKKGGTTVDVFAGSVVTVAPNNNPQVRDFRWDRSDWDDLFGGVYASTTELLEHHRTEAYVLHRNKSDNGTLFTDPTLAAVPARALLPYDVEQRVTTLGLRAASLPDPALDGWDWEAEAAFQFGSVANQAGKAGVPAGVYLGSQAQLDHGAWAAHLQAGKTLADASWKPRLGLFCDFATGDSDGTDGKNGSFMSQFPTNHKFYGAMDAFAWKNMLDAGFSVSAQPAATVTLRLDQHFFQLDSTSDGWFRANAVATVRPVNAAARAASADAGAETDLTVTWKVRPWASLQAGYSHFFAGDYLKATGAGDDADFLFSQVTLSF